MSSSTAPALISSSSSIRILATITKKLSSSTSTTSVTFTAYNSVSIQACQPLAINHDATSSSNCKQYSSEQIKFPLKRQPLTYKIIKNENARGHDVGRFLIFHQKNWKTQKQRNSKELKVMQVVKFVFKLTHIELVLILQI